MFWKIYSILFLLVYAADLHQPQSPVGWMIDVVSALGLIAIFGYSFRLPFLHPAFWRITFWLLIASAIYNQIAHPENDIIALAIAFPFIAPAYIAAYRYAYQSSHFWTAPQPTPAAT